MERSNKGQSLIELLIAMAFGTLVLLTSFGLLQFLIKLGATDPVIQAGGFMAREAAQSAAAAAAGSWNAVGKAATGTSYYVTTSPAGFIIVAGTSTMSVNNIAYVTAIKVDPVCRDEATDAIVDCGVSENDEDSGTKKVTATVSWTYQGKPYAETVARYVVRTGSESVVQTDWSGGESSPSDPAISVVGSPTQFYRVATGTIDYSGTPGSIRIQGY